MKLIILCLFGILASVCSLSLEQIADLKTVNGHSRSLEHTGCSCFRHMCYCEGEEEGTKVGAILMVNELHMHCHRCTKIAAQFFINDVRFEKNFQANKFEDFCHTVKSTRYCFRVDVLDHHKGVLLKGCLDMSRPKHLHIGCFNLPLLTSINKVIEEDTESDVTQEDETQYVDESESTEELDFRPF